MENIVDQNTDFLGQTARVMCHHTALKCELCQEIKLQIQIQFSHKVSVCFDGETFSGCGLNVCGCNQQTNTIPKISVTL